MKLRLVEEFRVEYGNTMYLIERHDGGWFDEWELVQSYSSRADAEETFSRFKRANGEYRLQKVLEEWSSKS